MIDHRCVLYHLENSMPAAPGCPDDSSNTHNNFLCADRVHNCSYIFEGFFQFYIPCDSPLLRDKNNGSLLTIKWQPIRNVGYHFIQFSAIAGGLEIFYKRKL